MKYIHCIIIASTFLIASQQVAAKVYKWTDAKGQTHYSEQAPANQVTEVIKPKTGHSEHVDYSSTVSTSSAATTAPAANEPATHVKDPERCAIAQKNKSTLETSTRVQFKGDDGEYRYLSPDELQQKMNDAMQAIDESCG